MALSVAREPVSVKRLLHYRGGPICSLGDNTLVYAVGDHILRYDAETGDMAPMAIRGLSVECIATCPKRKFLAYTNKGLRPTITVLDMENDVVLKEFEGGAELEYSALAFSRDGKRLVSVAGIPDFTLTVWNIEDVEQLPLRTPGVAHGVGLEEEEEDDVMEEVGDIIGRVTVDVAFRCVSFNPKNNIEFCSSGDGQVTFWTIDPTAGKVIGTPLVQVQGIVDPNLFLDIHCHCWSPDDGVYCGCTGGELVKFDSRTGEMVSEGPIASMTANEYGAVEGGSLNSIILTTQYLITAGADGHIRFYDPTYHQIQDTMMLGNHDVRSMVLCPDMVNMVVGCEDGSVFKIDPSQVSAMRQYHVGNYHTGPINSIGVFHESIDTFATGGEDGTLRVWDNQKGTMAAICQLGTPVRCLACSKRDYVAVGSTMGVLAVVNMSRKLPEVTFRVRLHHVSVSAVSWDIDSGILACGTADGRVYFVDASDAALNTPENDLVVIGFAQVFKPAPKQPKNSPCAAVTSLFWDTKGHLYAASFESNLVAQMQAPVDPSSEQEGKLLDKHVKLCMMKIDGMVNDVIADKAKDKQIILVNEKKGLVRYLFPQGGSPNNVVEPISNLSGDSLHQKTAEALAIHPEGTLIATGSNDGRVALRNPRNFEDANFLPGRMDPFLNGVNCVAFSSDGKFVYAGGKDGSVFVWSRDEADSVVHPSQQNLYRSVPGSTEIKEFVKEGELTAFEKKIREKEEADAPLNEELKVEVRTRLDQFRERFFEILKRNETTPDEEKLERMEFVIDVEKYQDTLSETDTSVKELQKKIRFQNIANDLIKERVKTMCWDSQEDPMITLKALRADLEVDSYPIPKYDASRAKLLEKIKCWRFTEIEEKNLNSVEHPDIGDLLVEKKKETVPTEVVEEQASKADAIEGGDGEGKGDGEDGGAELEEEEDMDESRKKKDFTLRECLYSNFSLHTRSRKIMQIKVLEGIITEDKIGFNTEIKALLEQKQNEIHKIEERNTRIAAILIELKLHDDIFEPKLDALEEPESLLEVHDEEVPCDKYVSAADREKAEAARLAEEQKRKNNKDNAYDRALKQMMGGTLEDKKAKGDGLEEMIRPQWMIETPADELTEDQKNEIKEFEKKEKAWREELEKQRKVLEAELKKLLDEVATICNTFDEQLREMLDKKIVTSEGIAARELYIIKILQSMIRDEDLKKQESKANELLNTTRDEQFNSSAVMEAARKKLDKFKSVLDGLHGKDKHLEKEFRQFCQENKDYSELMVKLYKRRRRNESADSQNSQTLDPYLEYEQSLTAQNEFDELDMVEDMPEGMDERTWTTLCDLRKAKIESEQQLKIYTSQIDEMRERYEIVVERNEEIAGRLNDALTTLNAIREKRMKDSRNLDVPLTFKQGQIEVEQDAVVTDYSDAIMILTPVIEDLNTEICERGEEKLVLLQDIKNIRRTTVQHNWECDRLDMVAEDLVQQAADFQLLRVTKGLQEMVRGAKDWEARQAAECKKIESQILHVAQVHAERVKEMDKVFRRVSAGLDRRLKDNEELVEAVDILETAVNERQIIEEVRTLADESKERQVTKRHSNLVIRRRMIDLAKVQADEIILLRQELDRLRRKSFPSFAQPLPPVHGPDDRNRLGPIG